MRFDDGIVGVVLILFAIGAVAYAQTFPTLGGMQFGPALFPTVIGGGLGVCGVLLVAQSALRRRTSVAQPWVELDDWARSFRPWGNALLVVAVVLGFGLTLGVLGYHIAAALSLLVLLLRLRVRPLAALLVAVAATALTHELFYGWLRVPLPWGVLEPVAW